MPQPLVLVIDDNANDFLLLCEASKEADFSATHEQIPHAHLVIPRLNAIGASTGRPDVILLDINLPRTTGHEVLRWIKSHPEHRSIPVVMYSSSVRKEDEKEAMEQGAIGFVEKPETFDEYLPLVKMLRDLIEFRSLGGEIPPRGGSGQN